MMASHDRHHGIWKIDERQNVGADIDVALHLLELGLRQFAGLVEDVLGHGELPRVVEQRRRFDAFQRRLIRHSERARETERVRLDAPHVAVRHVILGVDRHRERLDGRQIQAIEMRKMLARIVKPSERRPQGEVKDDEQRHEDDRGEQIRLVHQQHEAERHGRSREVIHRQPEEVLAPHRHGERRASRPMAMAIRPELVRKYTAVSARSGTITCPAGGGV